jgi:hypothetical protein
MDVIEGLDGCGCKERYKYRFNPEALLVPALPPDGADKPYLLCKRNLLFFDIVLYFFLMNAKAGFSELGAKNIFSDKDAGDAKET